jgi:nicotinic acid phosphoribosyltransferase
MAFGIRRNNKPAAASAGVSAAKAGNGVSGESDVKSYKPKAVSSMRQRNKMAKAAMAAMAKSMA